MSIVARLEGHSLRPELELAALLEQANGDGAIVSFTGVARPESKGGQSVYRIILEHHPTLTVKSLEDIAAEAAARFDISHVRIVHRCGEMAAGECIVFAGAAALHRRAAFDATDYVMDRLKTEAVFWKREIGERGSEWIEPTDADYADRERWDRSLAGIHEKLTFHPLRIAVLTVSDSRTEETDKSGALLAERLTAAGHDLAGKAIVRDDVEAIRAQVRDWVDDEAVDVIVSTGGTGFAPRDVTPEAVKPLFRRHIDGFSILFHQASLGTVGFSTLQSRAFAGQIDDTFVFCLPGSTGACRDGWDLVLKYALDSRYRPCSLAGQIPRLRDLCA
jgi:molybdenum cofactor biosynthesis protein B